MRLVRVESRKKTLLLTIGWIAFGACAWGQEAGAPAKSAVTQTFAYEVVSVKPTQSENSSWQGKADGFLAVTSLRSLILSAYGVRMMDEISGLPGWGDSAQFHVEAKMDEDQAAALAKLPKEERWKQEQMMMQALLADRFNLKAHLVTKAGPIYALVVAKGGPKFKESTGGRTMNFGYGQFEGRSMSIDMMVYALSGMVGRLIVDKTGLTGTYDISLKWTPDDLSGTQPNDTGPSIFTALEDQLGLKLVSDKAPIDYVVVDHVEQPSAN